MQMQIVVFRIVTTCSLVADCIRITLRHNPEKYNPHFRLSENLKYLCNTNVWIPGNRFPSSGSHLSVGNNLSIPGPVRGNFISLVIRLEQELQRTLKLVACKCIGYGM